MHRKIDTEIKKRTEAKYYKIYFKNTFDMWKGKNQKGR